MRELPDEIWSYILEFTLDWERTHKQKFKLYQPEFRRNFVHISDISKAFLFSINNFKKLRNNIFNLGLNNANITKLELCKKKPVSKLTGPPK